MAIDKSNPQFELELCAPEAARLVLKVKEVILPGAAGVLTVRKGHTPLLTTLIPGALIITDAAGEEEFYAVNGGFAEVVDDRVLVLTSGYEQRGMIDLKRAEVARERAEMRLRKREEGIDLARAEAALARSLARMQAEKRQHY